MHEGIPACEAVEQQQRQGPQRRRRWYSGLLMWWVAACLVALALSANRQLAIQRRILERSRSLERIVTDSREVSEQTNAQLAVLHQLLTATTHMHQTLRQAGSVNSEIKTDLEALQQVVEEVRRSVATLDGQTGRSRSLLQEIERQSGALQAELGESLQTGGQVTQALTRLVQLQEAINADLAEIDRKTGFLDKLAGGG